MNNFENLKFKFNFNNIIKETKLQKKINERDVDSCGFIKQFQINKNLFSCLSAGFQKMMQSKNP